MRVIFEESAFCPERSMVSITQIKERTTCANKTRQKWVMMIRFECFESPPASVRTGREQAWEWGITAWFRQARMSVLGGREQQETGADCAPPRLGHGASSPRLMVCVCLSRGMAPGWRCWSLVRGPLALVCLPARSAHRRLGPQVFPVATLVNSHSDSHTQTQAPCIPQAVYPRAFAAWGMWV